MSKYTDDRFVVRKWEGLDWPEDRYSIATESSGHAIAISPRYAEDEDTEMYFRFMAKAPEMLEILKEVAKGNFNQAEVLEKSRALITEIESE